MAELNDSQDTGELSGVCSHCLRHIYSSCLDTTWLTLKCFCPPVNSYLARQNGDTQGGVSRLITSRLLTVERGDSLMSQWCGGFFISDSTKTFYSNT